MIDDYEFDYLAEAPDSSFDCRKEEQNRFFLEHSWSDQVERLSTTYVIRSLGLVAGYATVCTDALPLSRRERGPMIRFRTVSAIKLAQLGVDHRFQGRGIGSHAVGFVLGLANEIGKRVGCRYVTLDAEPALVSWYEDLGFVRNELYQEQRLQDAIAHRRDPASLPVSMRYDLRRAA